MSGLAELPEAIVQEDPGYSRDVSVLITFGSMYSYVMLSGRS